jgi:hypothetical protein
VSRLLALVTSVPFTHAVSAIGGAMVGTGVTYLVIQKKAEAKYEEILEKEIASTREFYAKRYKAEAYSDIPKYEDEPDEEIDPREENLAKEAIKVLQEQAYIPYNTVEPVPVQTEKERLEVVGSIKKNVFEERSAPIQETEEFDPEMQAANKSARKPYILEHDAFYDNEENHQQLTLTYFEEDDVLVDEQDRPIPNKDAVVGAGNLRFGYGTDQENVVLIHNPLTGYDYEVTRSNKSYSSEILGLDFEQEKRPLRRFRADD